MISSENENLDEVKHGLLCAKLELITARMEANAKIKKYEETVKHLYKLLKKVCQERDEARDQLQLLMRNFQPAETSSTVPQVDRACLQYKTKPLLMNSTKESDSSSKELSNHSCDLSLSSPNEKHSSMGLLLSHTRTAEPSNYLTLPSHQNKAGTCASRDNNMVDSGSLVIDKLVCGKPLPQKGRLLQSVTEAGPLLHTLLVAPVPQWKNPPPLSSSGLALSGNQDNMDDKASVNPNGFIPTSLSLAFPGNSHGPSATGFGLSVKNEPMSYLDTMDSGMMHYHVLSGKKRKLL